MKENMENKNTEDEKIEDEINILDYFIVLAKRKKLIISITLSVAIITAIYSLIMPPIYRAETTILSPQQRNLNIPSKSSKQFGRLSGLLGGNVFTQQPLYLALLRSNTFYDRIIDRFGLMDTYDVEKRETAREILANSVELEPEAKTVTGILNQSRIIKIFVQNKDPKMAADMANAFVEELKNMVQNLAITDASLRRLFLEEQLKQIKDALIKSEENMKEFQEKTGILKVESQAKAVIESIANLRALIAAKEVELKVMKTYSTPTNPDLQKVEETLKGLKIELTKLEAKDGSNPNPLMPTGRMPAVGTDYIRKLRELKFNENLFELIASMYEVAKIDESRDAAIIQIIDKAKPPEKRIKPKRRKMVMIATFVGFFFSTFLAFFIEYIEKRSESVENRKRIETLKRYLSFKGKK